MASLPEAPPESTDDTALLVRARQLRAAAVAAGRPDVAAKADEAIALLASTEEPKTDAADTVTRIMNGLGL